MNIEDIKKLSALLEEITKGDQPQEARLRHQVDFYKEFSPHTARAILALAERQLDNFQQRVRPWMMACFGAEIAADGAERNHRFLEEALELVQSTGCTASEAHQLVDYVYGRPVGEPAQEVGGVMVTLAALCLAQGLDMHAAGEMELTRIWTKVEAIRAKQAAKPKHSPLPVAIQPNIGRRAVQESEFAAFCEREGYPSDGPMDEVLRKAFYAGADVLPAPYLSSVQSWNAIRETAFEQAIEACGKAASNRAQVRAYGASAHYSACAEAIRAVAAEAPVMSTGRAWQLRAERAEADLAKANQWRAAALAENQQSGERWAKRVAELEAQLAHRRAPLSPETQQAIAAARAAGQSIAATPVGLVFINDGAEPYHADLDCPACGGSGHAADTPGRSAP